MLRHEFIDRGSSQTIAAFASASSKVAVPYFEWRSTLEDKGVNALLLVDERRTWWHSCIDEVLALLAQYKPTRLIGTSMGGYGALLFAQLTDIPAVAMAAQTVLTADWDTRYEDWWRIVRAETKRPDLLALSTRGEQHHLHYCDGNEIDRRHAERMEVKLFPHRCDKHKVTQFMDIPAALQ